MLHHLHIALDFLCTLRQRITEQLEEIQLYLADVNPHGAGAL